jgi:hypothetical protein
VEDGEEGEVGKKGETIDAWRVENLMRIRIREQRNTHHEDDHDKFSSCSSHSRGLLHLIRIVSDARYKQKSSSL